ncbi:hypothetical protein PM082_024358 [Marasmius tenuissimus]|nr:hypothetical protein PM082_024358 [Marasmius tenuissimus]
MVLSGTYCKIRSSGVYEVSVMGIVSEVVERWLGCRVGVQVVADVMKNTVACNAATIAMPITPTPLQLYIDPTVIGEDNVVFLDSVVNQAKKTYAVIQGRTQHWKT